MDLVIVEMLRKDPGTLGQARRWIEKKLNDPGFSEQGKQALQEWHRLMEQRGLDGVLGVLSGTDEECDRMRQSSPFAFLMPHAVRQSILKRYESLRTRAHPAGV